MSMGLFTSLLLVLGCSLPIYYLTHVFVAKLSSGKMVAGVILASVTVSSLAIWYVDMKVPLIDTHLRSTGEVLPIGYALLAWVAKLWFLTCCIVGARVLRKRQDHA